MGQILHLPTVRDQKLQLSKKKVTTEQKKNLQLTQLPFRVQGLVKGRFGVSGSWLEGWFRVQDLGFERLKFKVEGLGFRIEGFGLEFRVRGSGLKDFGWGLGARLTEVPFHAGLRICSNV